MRFLHTQINYSHFWLSFGQFYTQILPYIIRYRIIDDLYTKLQEFIHSLQQYICIGLSLLVSYFSSLLISIYFLWMHGQCQHKWFCTNKCTVVSLVTAFCTDKGRLLGKTGGGLSTAGSSIFSWPDTTQVFSGDNIVPSLRVGNIGTEIDFSPMLIGTTGSDDVSLALVLNSTWGFFEGGGSMDTWPIVGFDRNNLFFPQGALWRAAACCLAFFSFWLRMNNRHLINQQLNTTRINNMYLASIAWGVWWLGCFLIVGFFFTKSISLKQPKDYMVRLKVGSQYTQTRCSVGVVAQLYAEIDLNPILATALRPCYVNGCMYCEPALEI